MSLFGKLLTHNKTAAPSVTESCRHADLGPMWDNLADMGSRDRVTHYKCSHCHQILSAEEGRALLDARTGGVGTKA